MRLNRTLLYAGVFVTAIGAALLVVDLSSPSANQLIEALGLWPVVPIAAGLALVLRRTSFSLPSGLLAALVPGLVLGALLALWPRVGAEYGWLDELKREYRLNHVCDVGGSVDFGTVHIDSIGGCP